MLIVFPSITIKFRTRKQTSKPQTDYRFCLRYSFHVPYWLFPCNTVTFHKYFCIHCFESFVVTDFHVFLERIYTDRHHYWFLVAWFNLWWKPTWMQSCHHCIESKLLNFFIDCYQVFTINFFY